MSSSSPPPPSSSSSSTSYKLSKIEQHQQEDLRSIRVNKKNIEKNYEDIGKNIDAIAKNNKIARRRIKDLEATVATLGENYKVLAAKLEKVVSAGPATTSATSNPKKKANKPKQRTHQDRADKLLEIARRSAEMMQLRSGLIKFNKTNPTLPDGEKHVWERRSNLVCFDIFVFCDQETTRDDKPMHEERQQQRTLYEHVGITWMVFLTLCRRWLPR